MLPELLELVVGRPANTRFGLRGTMRNRSDSRHWGRLLLSIAIAGYPFSASVAASPANEADAQVRRRLDTTIEHAVRITLA